MPHTSRRKARPMSNKLTKVTTEDGWTILSRKSNPQQLPHESRGKNPNTTDHVGHKSFEAGLERIHERLTLRQIEHLHGLTGSNESSTEVLPRPSLCSETELKLRFDETKRSWLASRIGERVTAILFSQIGAHALRGIDKAICLGLGSLSVDKLTWRRTTMWQLVAFLEIVQECKPPLLARRRSVFILRHKAAMTEDRNQHAVSKQATATKSTLYAQDPAFNAVDKAFLASLGVNVLDSPQAFMAIDSATFVFAPHYPVTWWPPTMRLNTAPLIIGNDVEKALPRIPQREELTRIFQNADGGIAESDMVDLNVREELVEFLRVHESLTFPHAEEDQHAFIDLRIYWEKGYTDEILKR